jgi:gliding motility-associated-like protein
VTVSGSGGNTPYSYNIGGGTYGSSTTFSNLKAGTYTLGIKDKNGCTKSTTVTISEPSLSLSVVSSSVTNVLCKGNSTGSITVSGSGGTPSYSYNIGGGTYGSSNTFSSLSAGTYSIGIKDANGCTSSVSVTITEPSSTLSISTSSTTNISCYGGTTGSITVSGSGGVSPYTYNISSGSYSSSSTFSTLAAGTYTVGVKDNNGCTASVSVTLSQPSSALSGSTTQSNVTCNGSSDGSITLTPSGGTSSYSYSWTGPGTYTSTTQSPGTLAAGTYTYVITDAKSCTYTNKVTITEPGVLSVTGTITNVDCKGNSTGSIVASGSGGTGSYSYNIGGGTYGSSNTFSSLSAGTYTIGIKDANGCTKTASVTVSEPSSSLSVSSTSTVNVDCKGGSTGSITVSGSGGTSPYSYRRSSSSSFGSSNTFTGLSAGTYTIEVQDKNGCTSSVSVTITEPSTSLSGSTTQSNVTCNGLGDGSITLTTTGGTGPYTYYWTGPGTYTSTNQNPGSLIAGSYTYQITDKNGCVKTGSVNITEPTKLSVSYSSLVNVDCKGNATGSLVAVGSGGTLSYTYNIGGGTYSSNNGFTGLTAGTYTIGVKDGNGCTNATSVTITEPTNSLSLTSTITNVDCKGNTTGEITLNASGGTTAYSYSINGGTYGSNATFTGLSAGNYSMLVKDKNGCTKSINAIIVEPNLATTVSVSSIVDVDCKGNSTGTVTLTGAGGTSPYYYNLGSGSYGSSSVFDKLAAGTYTFGIKDANGCISSILATVKEPNSTLLITSTQTNVSCKGLGDGSISVSASGGTSAYTYNIGGAGYGTSTLFNNLAAGSYTVGVKDNRGCVTNSVVTITEPNELTIAIVNQINVACNGAATGEIKVGGNGGTTAYSYNINGGTYGSNPNFTSLKAGNYTIGIKDKNGCTSSISTTITEPTLLVLSASNKINIDCNGGTNGSITVAGSGGKSPYTYNINGGVHNSSNSFTGLSSGTYTVGIKDDNGCSTSISVVLTEPTVLGLTTTKIVDVDCAKNKNGSITVAGSGGVAPYLFNINGGSYQTSNVFSGLSGGNYSIGIKDNNGCTKSITVSVVEPANPVSLSHTQINASCFGLGDGSVSLTSSGGTPSYMYNIGGGTYSTSSTMNNLSAGKYSIVVKDNNGCTDTTLVTITEPDLLVVNVKSVKNVDCKGNSTGTVVLDGIGGTKAYSYNQGSGTYTTSNTFLNLSAGTFTFGIKDKNGCLATETVTITEPGALTVSISVADVSCDGGSDGLITTNATGGTPKYQYKLNTGGTWQTANVFSGLSKGTYTIYLKDSNLCTTSQSVSVGEAVIMNPVFDLSSSSDLCLGNTHYFSGSKSTINTGTFSISWDFGDGNTGSGTTLGHKYSSTGTYTVAMTMTSSTGCKKVVKQTVKVFPVPVVQFCSIDALNNCKDSQCLRGNDFKFNSTSYIANGSITTYNWDFGDSKDTSGSPLTSINHSYQLEGSYTAVLTLESDKGCVNQGSYKVKVLPHPFASASLTNSDPCYNSNYFDFTSNGSKSVTGSMITKYLWRFGTGSNPSTSATDMPSNIAYSTDGTKFIGLIIQDQNGCTDDTTISTIVYPSPSPKIGLNTSTPNSTQCFRGNAFKFENKSTIKSGTMKFSWDFGDGTTSSATNPPTKNYSKEGTYTVKLTATSNSNCTETTTFKIVILASPKADFTTNAICSTSYSIVFNDASSIAIGKINTYEWLFGDNTSAKTKNPTHTYPNAGSYNVSLIVESDMGCIDTLTKVVSAYDKIVAKFDVNRNNCGINTQVQFTNKSSTPASSTYNWNFGDNTVSNQANPIHQFNSADTFLVTLKIISPDGCEATAKESVFIYPKPEASFTNETLICNNSGAVKFTNNSKIIGDTLFNDWNFGDGNTSNLSSPSHTYSNFGAYQVKLKVRTNKGCLDSVTKTINVRPKPLASFAITNLDPCLSNNSITLENQSSIPSGSLSYQWKLSDGTRINDVSPFKHSFKRDTSYQLKLVVTSAYGCKDSTEKSTEIFPNPIAKIEVNSDSQCFLNNKFEFNDSSKITANGGISNQRWNFGDGTIDTLSGPKVFKSYNAQGEYYVELKVITKKGCSDKTILPIRVFDMPKADFSVNADKQCYIGNEFNFYNKSTITTGNGTLGYDWEFGDGNASSNISPNNKFAQPGTYNITLLVTSSFGCQNTIIKPIEVYQNPDAPNITIDRTIPCHGMLGGLKSFVTGGVLPYQYSWNGGNLTSNGNLDSIPAGWYTLEVADKNGCKNKDSFELKQPNPLTAKMVKVSDALCYGFSNATAKLDSLSGGVAPYFTEWFLGNKSVKVGLSLNGVKANQTDLEFYKVLVRDFNGCTLRDSIHLSQPTKMEGQMWVSSPIKCYDSLGAVQVSIKGGVKNPNRFMGYDFYWNGSKSPGNNVLSGIQAGVQRVLIYDLNGCVLLLSMEIKEPAKLLGNIDSAVNVLCNGDQNGRLYASAVGGLKNYRYYWTDTFNRTIREGQNLDGIGAGFYKLVVKDRNGCVDSVKNWIEVLEPEPIAISLLERMNITCYNGNNGKLRVAASGGNGGYRYEWNTDPIPVVDSMIENLSSGKYIVTVTDLKGCKYLGSYTFANPKRNSVIVPNDSVEICNLDTLNLLASMQNVRYYEWKFNNQIVYGSKDSVYTLRNVQKYDGGIYTVTGTDEKGCVDSANILVRINDLPSVSVVSMPAVACLGSTCDLEASGAKKYHWFKERYSPVYGLDTLLGNYSTYTIKPVGLADVGRYFVVGESVQGCRNMSSVIVKVGLDSISAPGDTQVCAGGNLALRAKGAVSYEWTAPNGNRVVSPSYLITPVSKQDSGIYTLKVTDRWNCQGKYSVNVLVNPKPQVSIVDVLNSNHCEGADVELIGNTDASKMDWIGPNFKKLGTTRNIQVIPSVTIKDQGEYKLIGYTDFGCMDSATAFVKVNPIPIADFQYTHNCPPNPIAGEDVNFFTTSLRASKYEFYIDNELITKENGFKTKFITPGSYVVKMIAFNDHGCSKEISKAIVVEDPWKLWVPNAFTPNNDRLNSEFKPVTLNVPNYKMYIYDRWGAKIFEGENNAWDGRVLGKPAPIGVYAVKIDYSTICSDDKLILDKSEFTEVTIVR